MTCQQFDELLAFNSLEPIGSERLIWCMANGFATLANLWASEGKVQPWQFVPGAEEPVATGSPRAVLGMLNGNSR